jgi:hypothetical protein
LKGTLVIIDEKKKGYRCYIPEWKKVVTSKDVTIDEKGNLVYHVDVGRHEDVINENQIEDKKYLPPASNWNIDF